MTDHWICQILCVRDKSYSENKILNLFMQHKVTIYFITFLNAFQSYFIRSNILCKVLKNYGEFLSFSEIHHFYTKLNTR